MSKFFRRTGFNKPELRNMKPKWHIAYTAPDDVWGMWSAICGYSFNNILGGLMFRDSVKDSKLICTKCAKLNNDE